MKSLLNNLIKKYGSNILIFKNDGLGDQIIISGHLKKIINEYSRCKIYLLVDKKWKFYYRNYKYINAIYVNNKRFRFDLIYRIYMLAYLRSLKINIIIDPSISRRPNSIIFYNFINPSLILKWDQNLSVSYEKYTLNYKIKVKNVSFQNINKKTTIHELDYLDFFFKLIANLSSCRPLFNNFKKNDLMLNHPFVQSKNIVLIFTGRSFEQKHWGDENFNQLIVSLNSKYDNLFFIIAGQKNETNFIKNINIKNIMQYNNIDFNSLTHLINESQIIIGNDTGFMHLAFASDKNLVGIVGGGHFGRFFPYPYSKSNQLILSEKMNCYYCNWNCIHDTVRCIKDIHVNYVFNNIVRIYENKFKNV
ncbi:glycosyltransferase family 9 protein [Methylophilaceae bacterium Uisw_097]